MGESNKPVWPHLEDLSLEKFQGGDGGSVRLFFAHLGPLKYLRIANGDLGPHCFDVLRERHFDSLRTLCMENLSSITSEMVLGVLQQCAQLEVFETRRMSLLDLSSEPRTLGLSWTEAPSSDLGDRPYRSRGEQDVFRTVVETR